jgi:hypothetical protein
VLLIEIVRTQRQGYVDQKFQIVGRYDDDAEDDDEKTTATTSPIKGSSGSGGGGLTTWKCRLGLRLRHQCSP